MAVKKKTTNIRKYKRTRETNIGIVVFLIILVYLIVSILNYATRTRIAQYEVRLGSIIRDMSYTGLVIREEEVFSSPSTGYVYYFQTPGSKIRSDAPIFAISPRQLNKQDVSVAEVTFETHDSMEGFVTRTQSFNENFQLGQFASVYSFRNYLENNLGQTTEQSRIAQIDAVMQASGGQAQIVNASRDGILILRVDGLENLTPETIRVEDLGRSEYSYRNLADMTRLQMGEPAYKLVTNEIWSIVIQVNEDVAKQLEERNRVRIRVEKDNQLIWSNPRVIESNGNYLAVLTMNNGMVRYTEYRHLNIELLLENHSGLMIPRSAVIEKDFYLVPEDFMTTNERGVPAVLIQEANNTTRLQTVSVFHTNEDGAVYLDPLAFADGSVLVRPGSTVTFALDETSSLTGAFNVNRGYAIFRVVRILAGNEDYYIVQEGDRFGLINFDRIVQDGSLVEEFEVVVR